VVKIVGDFIAAHSAPVALREGVLYVRVLQPALHYELEQVPNPNPTKTKTNASAAKPSATSGSASADLNKNAACASLHLLGSFGSKPNQRILLSRELHPRIPEKEGRSNIQ